MARRRRCGSGAPGDRDSHGDASGRRGIIVLAEGSEAGREHGRILVAPSSRTTWSLCEVYISNDGWQSPCRARKGFIHAQCVVII